MKNLRTFMILFMSFVLLFSLCNFSLAQGKQAPIPYGRFQIVSGQYDVKITKAGSEKPEYETHHTMFLIDTHTGKVWLFMAEDSMYEGRWGWIPAKGVVEKEQKEKNQ